MFRLIDSNWSNEFIAAARTDTKALRIICPFIKAGALERLLEAGPKNIQVITRFNLADFAGGVSDIEALRRLLQVGAKVRGIRNLHAKLYVFGKTRAISTSANLTAAALDRNHEFGFVTGDPVVINNCQTYFDDLWPRGGPDLTIDQVDEWDKTVTEYRARGGKPDLLKGLEDFGSQAGFGETTSFILPTAVSDATQSFVKFFGKSDSREALCTSTIDETKQSGCHWALSYPKTKRPRSVQENALMFIARMTKEPNDIRVYGRAIGLKYVPGRDDATEADKELRPFKKTWSRYIRVSNAQFVAGPLSNGISLSDLMKELGSNSFASTQRNAERGTGNTKPRRAFRQQAAVELSNEGRVWLNERLQEAFDLHGTVPQTMLKKLDWPTLP